MSRHSGNRVHKVDVVKVPHCTMKGRCQGARARGDGHRRLEAGRFWERGSSGLDAGAGGAVARAGGSRAVTTITVAAVSLEA